MGSVICVSMGTAGDGDGVTGKGVSATAVTGVADGRGVGVAGSSWGRS